MKPSVLMLGAGMQRSVVGTRGDATRSILFSGFGLLAMALLNSLGILQAQERPRWETPRPRPPVIAEASDEATQAMGGFQKPDGFDVSLFAAEPQVANIVAIYVDMQGRVWVCETFRQKVGVADNRGNERWLDEDLAARTVEDRYAYMLKHIPDATTSYTANDDRIRLLIDEDGDFVADSATVFADGFNDVVAGTGAGVLSYRDKVYYTCIPDLWILADEDGDHVAEVRESRHYGFGVRFAFRGHDMHGLTLGPDGRLYFSIGDRGYNVPTMDGLGENPESGAVFRCELDGSRLEVFASGLRNPQELAFDEWGNLFTGDNNSDSGDQARWVHVVQGGDSGWRMSYQYLPDRGPFNREKIWHPAHPGQPAYIVPPVVNFADGPSGLTYYPGTGLGDEFIGRFLLCDFRGQASNSGIRSFRMQPKGAGFEMIDAAQPFWNILATDADFGPDGALYVADWIHGWDGLDKGRIYRFTNPEAEQSEVVQEVKRLLNTGMQMTDEVDLVRLLGHQDRRLRQEAQFELARRGAFEAFDGAARYNRSLLARVHAIWGIGQIARGDARLDEASETLAGLLRDKEAEVRAQACSVIGDLRDTTYAAQVAELLLDAEPRVRFFAAQAIGRLEYPAALPNVVRMLSENADSDVVLRHAGIMALAGIAKEDSGAVRELSQNNSVSVRLAATVALRKNSDSNVALFLNDADPAVVVEAARAIHDLPLNDALPALAALIDRPSDNDDLVRRILNANYRLGSAENAESLARFAATTSNEAWGQEALELLALWTNGLGRDRVLGMWRPVEARESVDAREALDRHLSELLGRGGVIADRATDVASSLGIEAIIPRLVQRVTQSDLQGSARAAALRALAQLNADGFDAIVSQALSAEAPELRAAAADLMIDRDQSKALEALSRAVHSDYAFERQAAFASLGRIAESPQAREQLTQAAQRLAAGQIPADTVLDVITAIERLPEADRDALLADYWQTLDANDELARYRPAMVGGDAARGERLFYERASLSCVRCHTIGGVGGQVGPNLSRIGLDKEREYLLQAIVLPNAAIAKDFEGVLIQTLDGSTIAGIVKTDDEVKMELLTAEGNIVTVLKEDIDAIVPGKSSMPEDLVKHLSALELRDLIEFLAAQQSDPIDGLEHGEGR